MTMPPAGQLTGIVIATATATPMLHIGSLAADVMTVKPRRGSERATSCPTSPLLPKPKQEENPQKLAFLGSLGLVTHDRLQEIQSRRQERKRRTTANPVYSGAVFEPEHKKSAVTYLNTPVHQGPRKRGEYQINPPFTLQFIHCDKKCFQHTVPGVP
ncbi:hypothetical protein SKAU_G00245700 [Synaphobranchus kaupii]|uniref:Uncharacterized protein n=1 Tax=Synaphobranchus kaupii TaxID=118154 RepID=A0A9Q1F1S7_SYNKA|nr:hypothetical protein SKAU_G00245700 [Synaphobranchus kaupii]